MQRLKSSTTRPTTRKSRNGSPSTIRELQKKARKLDPKSSTTNNFLTINTTPLGHYPSPQSYASAIGNHSPEIITFDTSSPDSYSKSVSSYNAYIDRKNKESTKLPSPNAHFNIASSPKRPTASTQLTDMTSPTSISTITTQSTNNPTVSDNDSKPSHSMALIPSSSQQVVSFQDSALQQKQRDLSNQMKEFKKYLNASISQHNSLQGTYIQSTQHILESQSLSNNRLKQ